MLGIWTPGEHQGYERWREHEQQASMPQSAGARLAGVGFQLQSGIGQPDGFLDDFVENRTMVDDGCFYVKYSRHLPASDIYFELDRHVAPERSYTALVYLNVEVYELQDEENVGQHDALRADVLDHRKTDAAERAKEGVWHDRHDKFMCSIANDSHIGIAVPHWSANEGGDNVFTTERDWGRRYRPFWPLMIVQVERGWDDVDRFSTSIRGWRENVRAEVGAWCWFGVALFLWIGLIHAFRTRVRACKLSLCAAVMLACAAFFTDVVWCLPPLLAGDAWHTLPIAVELGLISKESGHGIVIGSDTAAGAGLRNRLLASVWVLTITRILESSAVLMLARSLWVERHVLVHCSVVLGLGCVYQAVIVPVIRLHGFDLVIRYYIHTPMCIAGLAFLCMVWAMQRRTRASITAMVKQDLGIWQQSYSEVISREGATAAAALERLARLSEPYLLARARHMHHPDRMPLSPGRMPRTPVGGGGGGRWSTGHHIASWRGWCWRVGASVWAGLGCDMRVGRASATSRGDGVLDDIDQIYLQAQMLQPFLSRMLQNWAGACDGIVQVQRAHAASSAGTRDCGAEAEAQGGSEGSEEQSKTPMTKSAAHPSPDLVAESVPAACSSGHRGMGDGVEGEGVGEEPRCGSGNRCAAAAAAAAVTTHRSSWSPEGRSDTSSSGMHAGSGSRAGSYSPAACARPPPPEPDVTCGAPATFEKWGDVRREMEGGTFCGEVCLCRLKRVHRMLDKTQRCYRGDASRLTDVCRGLLAFESLSALADCLDLILADPLIKVEAIKNRLDPAYDITETPGYRDVNVKLRILGSPKECTTSASWNQLKLSGHVCEVQLLHMEFLKLKTSERHKNYIRYRNLLSK